MKQAPNVVLFTVSKGLRSVTIYLASFLFISLTIEQLPLKGKLDFLMRNDVIFSVCEVIGVLYVAARSSFSVTYS